MPNKRAKKQTPLKLTEFYSLRNKPSTPASSDIELLESPLTSFVIPDSQLDNTPPSKFSSYSECLKTTSEHSPAPLQIKSLPSPIMASGNTLAKDNKDNSVLPLGNENTIRSLFQEFRESLQKDFMSSLSSLTKEVSQLGDRTAHLEDKMEKFTEAHNALVDIQNDTTDDMHALQLKISDLEDRSRRNNIRFRGISEEVSNSELREFLMDYFSILTPSVDARDMIIDRVHRLPKPPQLPRDIPRDVLDRIHFYHYKEEVMNAAKKN
ncbi:uncharacterized protein LOC130367075 [Hyla sarda]|uniref:uncharacterized protein LOC130367075 n=1 Tax=Hyla sarda TaxID=327740 RepID=UPI0024C24961|nr:uncharacterized protein LOC130367075 [Hyla sarda]